MQRAAGKNSTSVTFAELGVPTALTNVLDREGKRTAFPIQADTLADTLAGRDVLGRGKTGSGKTLAFSLPVVARIGDSIFGGNAAKQKSRPGHPRALILAPTRELATQIDAVIAPLAAAYQLKTATIFGGVSQHWQEKAMRAGVDIVVACPGRLEDLIRQRVVSLDAVKVTVLDEADHMADLGFLPAVTRILEATPSNGQRMLFSATLDKEVDRIVKRFLHEPVVHEVDSADSHVDAMTHHVFHVSNADAKRELVKSLASGTGRRVLFTRTKHQAQRLAKQLTADGIPAVDLHGNLAQRARDRNLARFAAGEARVLVATDVAARGVHVDGIELVVHVEPPAEHKAYLHRSGRTARAGSAGDVVTIVLPEQRKAASTLMRAANITVQPENVSAASPAVVALVGEKAPWVDPLVFAASERKEPGTNGPARPRRGTAKRGGNGRGSGAPRSGAPARSGGSQKPNGHGAGTYGGSVGDDAPSTHGARRPADRGSYSNRGNRRPNRTARTQG